MSTTFGKNFELEFSRAIEDLFDNEEYTHCEVCKKNFQHCNCICPYCGKRDKCECALFEAATGG